jgi:diadenosine tetraphosphatase ApaH/serine/threonine PP2A family protein phosphatase
MWEYILSVEDAQQAFSDFSGQICFVGHSHLPIFFIRDEQGQYRETLGPRVPLQAGFRYIANVGSVGQPRDGNRNASYLLFDDTEKWLELKRVPYELRRTQEKMQAAGLPYYLAARLALGR